MNNVILVGLVGNHHSLYSSLLQLFSSEFEKVTFLTTDANAKHIGVLNKKVRVIIDDGKIDIILKNNQNLIEHHDILILDEYFGLYSRVRKIKFCNRQKILIIHNTNKWLQSKLKFNAKYLYDQFYKDRFFIQFDAYLTMGPNIKDYFKSLKNDRPVFFFPFDQSIKNVSYNYNEEKETIDIVIPGMIDENRRNYVDILSILDRYYHENSKSRIRVKLLGQIVNGNDIVNILSDINMKYGNKVSYSRTFIPETEFQNEIQNADFILSNVHVINPLHDRVEIYGLSKESGISFIIYKHAKAAIVPQFQNILSGFDNQLIKYSKYDCLFDIFEKIENDEIDRFELLRNGIENRSQFNDVIESEINKFIQYLKDE